MVTTNPRLFAKSRRRIFVAKRNVENKRTKVGGGHRTVDRTLTNQVISHRSNGTGRTRFAQ